MPAYLDHNATSPMHPEVAEAILPFLRNSPENPASLHHDGRMARSAVETARAQVAALPRCASDDVIFTSGGTEANNLLITGGQQEHGRRGGTENVAGIVGLGEAAEIASLEIEHRQHYLGKLQDVFETHLAGISGTVVVGRSAPRLPHTTCLFGMDNDLQDVEALCASLRELVDRLPAVIRQAAV